METLTLVLWLILWPLSMGLGEYIEFKITGTPNDKENKKIQAAFTAAVWLIVGIILLIKSCK